jgi:hypothetical protein
VKLSKHGEGARLRFNLAESHVLEQLFGEVHDVLDPDALPPSDPVRQRLYPAAYEDPDAALDYRELTESGLHADRSERLAQCLAEVRAGRSIRRTEVTLDAEGAERWMRVLNDLRLTFGTQLNITEDDDYELDESDPQVHLRARYVWLTALQDALVRTVMG